MRKLLVILFIGVSFTEAQTTISPTTTIQQLQNMKIGSYSYTIKAPTGGTDTLVTFGKDTSLIIKTVFVHDTTIKLIHDTTIKTVINTVHDTVIINNIMPVDSAQIIANWVGAHPCPPPVICPPPPKQRTAIGVTWDIITNKKTIIYDDGTSSIL